MKSYTFQVFRTIRWAKENETSDTDKANENTQGVKDERFLISTTQKTVRILGIRCLWQSDKRTIRYKTRKEKTDTPQKTIFYCFVKDDSFAVL